MRKSSMCHGVSFLEYPADCPRILRVKGENDGLTCGLATNDPYRSEQQLEAEDCKTLTLGGMILSKVLFLGDDW